MAAAKKDPRSADMKAVIDVLTKKFDDDKILSRKGQGGKTFNYVKAQEYIVKLNDAFGVAWGAETTEHFLVNNQVVMRVSITVTNPDNQDTYVRDGWGSHPLGQDVGNSFKSAFSKAFTKAASMVGAGLHLWGVDADEDDAPTWDIQAGPPPVVVNPGGPPGAGAMPPPPVPAGNAVPGSPTPPVPMPPGASPVTPPTFANPTAPGAVPPTAAAPPPVPPPVPTGNPAPGAPPASAVGVVPAGPDGNPIGPVSVGVGVQSAGGGNRIQDFQINGIVGAAMTRGITDPMQLVRQILGDGVQGLTINDLTLEQAQTVLDAVRTMPPQ